MNTKLNNLNSKVKRKMIKLIDAKTTEKATNQAFPLMTGTKKSLRQLKTRTNSRTWDSLFQKMIYVIDRELNQIKSK